MKQIVSFSGGKDSTAMLHMMIERCEQIDAVVWFDTGWEFPKMEAHVQEVEKKTGIEIIRLSPKNAFAGYVPRYGWPDPIRRWCTRLKINALESFYKKQGDSIRCIGFALDEIGRTYKKAFPKKSTRFPLVEYRVTEREALEYCKRLGYTWGGLYDHFFRVSCFCCPLKGLNELRSLRKHYPELWGKMLEMDKFERNRGFRGYETVHDLDARFQREDAERQQELFETKAV